MRLCMMGTGPFAVPTFRSLLASDHEVVALVTRPSVTARSHGKEKTPPNPMRALAESRGLPILDPGSINESAVIQQLQSLNADLFVVCDYGQILSAEALSAAPLGGINLHGSLLPKYRGAAPIQWAIWNGEQETGVTVIHMSPRLDAGPTLVQRTTPIGSRETAEELEPRLAELGVSAVQESLQLLESWDRSTPIGQPQPQEKATRAPRLKKTDGEVKWAQTAGQIFNQYRAVQPWPGLYSNLIRDSKPPLRVILDRIEPSESEMGLPPGSIRSEGSLMVATGQGSLVVTKLQPAGKRVMDVTEFLRGTPVQAGDHFA